MWQFARLSIYAGSGYMRVNGERRPLPAGLSLSDGVFYWHPGPGFRGRYELVFERPDGTTVVAHIHIGLQNRARKQAF